MRSVRSTMWTLLTTIALAIGFGALIAATQINSWDNLDPAEKARFDPTAFSLSGLFLAQIAIGVLGVLIVTSEYATGQIRATLAATPQRLTVLAAKSITYVAVVFVVGLVASFGAFGDRASDLLRRRTRRIAHRSGRAAGRDRRSALPDRRRPSRDRTRHHHPTHRRRHHRPSSDS